MLHQPVPSTEDGNPDEGAIRAMEVALRDFKTVMRKSKEHPRRAEMLAILGDARAAIDRINGA